MPYGRSYRRRSSGNKRASYASARQAGYRGALVSEMRGTPANVAFYGATYKDADQAQKLRRKAFQYRGKGGYFSDAWDWTKRNALGMAKGAAEGLGRSALDNMPLGGAIRTGLNAAGYHGMGMYTGRGDYKNELIDGGGSNAPLFGNSAAGIVVSHKEYLSDIFGPPAGQAFNVQTLTVNPGLSSIFPFLSQLACNYAEYEFQQLIFTYKSTTTDIGNSTTGQCGTVVLVFNYNASEPAYTDKGAMMEAFGSVNVKCTENALMGVECDPAQLSGSPGMYVRANPVVTGQDLKTYDRGTFQLAVCNSPAAYANLPIGELWVDYTCVLRKPKLFASRGLDVDRDVLYASNSLVPSSGCSLNNPIGTTGNFLLAQQNSIGCLFQNGQLTYSGTVSPIQTTLANGFSIVLPSSLNGNLRITVNFCGATISGVPFASTPLLLGNVTFINDIYGLSGVIAGHGSYNVPDSTQQYVMDVFVRQATGIAYAAGTVSMNGTSYYGGNNCISFPAVSGAVSTTEISISVEQYQSMGGSIGLTSTASRMLFINNSGAVVTPVP